MGWRSINYISSLVHSLNPSNFSHVKSRIDCDTEELSAGSIHLAFYRVMGWINVLLRYTLLNQALTADIHDQGLKKVRYLTNSLQITQNTSHTLEQSTKARKGRGLNTFLKTWHWNPASDGAGLAYYQCIITGDVMMWWTSRKTKHWLDSNGPGS